MRWAWITLLLMIAIPIVEIAVMIAAAQQLGVLWALGLTVATTLAGGYVLRVESARSLRRLRQTMETGQVPGTESSHGGLRMLGGIALLAPGFVTDVIGVLLLLPPVRLAARALLLRGLVRRMSPEEANRVFGPRRVRAKRGHSQPAASGARPPGSGRHVIDGEILEGEILEPGDGPARGDADDSDDASRPDDS